jgi:hypothetical protein
MRKRRCGAISISFLVLGLLGCRSEPPPAGPPTTGSVAGTVTEVESGAPVTDAWLVLVDPVSLATVSTPARTDPSGRYRFDALAPGEYATFLFHDSLVVFDRSASRVQIRAGEVVTQNLRLLDSEMGGYRDWRIVGSVLDATTGQPVPGAYVGGVYTGGWVIEWAFDAAALQNWGVTDSQGRFSIGADVVMDEAAQILGLGPISVTRAGYEPFTLVGRAQPYPYLPTPAPGESVLTVSVRLQPSAAGAPAGAIRGIASFLGQPVPGIRVGVSISSVADPDTIPAAAAVRMGTDEIAVPLPGSVAVTDAEGRFLIAGLRPGEYSLAVAYLDDDGYGPTWGQRIRDPFELIQVVASDTADVGTVGLWRAILPIDPAPGATTADRTPEFLWQAFVPPSGYALREYEIGVSTRWFFYDFYRVTEPRWQLPDSLGLPAGAHVRWYVHAYAVRESPPDTLLAGTFERIATFSVSP